MRPLSPRTCMPAPCSAPSSAQAERGRDAVVRGWAGIVEGKKLKLLWYPTMVAIGGEPDIAYSSGRRLYESLAPGAKQRYSLGGFQSIWHKDVDGVWRVLFDDGVPPVPATAEQAEAFKLAREARTVRGDVDFFLSCGRGWPRAPEAAGTRA